MIFWWVECECKSFGEGWRGKLWPSVTTGQLPPTCVCGGEIKGWGQPDEEENHRSLILIHNYFFPPLSCMAPAVQGGSPCLAINVTMFPPHTSLLLNCTLLYMVSILSQNQYNLEYISICSAFNNGELECEFLAPSGALVCILVYYIHTTAAMSGKNYM